jgi:hypothetical protein
MTDRHLRIAAVAAFCAGIGLMIPFEHTATLLAGVLCLLAFIVLGVFAIANPEDLSRDDHPES